jgi:hypothetical protein
MNCITIMLNTSEVMAVRRAVLRQERAVLLSPLCPNRHGQHMLARSK